MTTRAALVGKIFGRLKVISFDGARPRGNEKCQRSYWLCQCECGTQKIICGVDLTSGSTKSCGCQKLERARQMGREYGGKRPIANLSGKRFGRLVVLSFSNLPNCRPHWLCQCDCGKQAVVSGLNLKSAHTRSCGCLHAENAIRQGLARRGLPSPNRTHGKSHTAIYRTWSSMIQRCENPNNPGWPAYGGRGIKVCDRWHSFELYDADLRSLGPKPLGASLDRVDNNGDYELSNVKWASQKEQVANQRIRKRIEMFSDADLVVELSRRGLSSL